MLRVLAVLFGLIMIALGILGIMPDMAPTGKLGGLLPIDRIGSYLYLGTGIISLLSGLTSKIASKTIFILTGIVYAVLAIMSFHQGSGKLFDLLEIHETGKYFHILIALFCLYFGIFLKTH
jgi:hypothetical protein